SWRGPAATFRYSWSTVSGPSLPYGADTHGEELVIPKKELQPGARYEIVLRVVAEYHDPDVEGDEATHRVTHRVTQRESRAEAESQVRFVVNAPPEGGSCEIDVAWRGPAAAAVKLSAPG